MVATHLLLRFAITGLVASLAVGMIAGQGDPIYFEDGWFRTVFVMYEAHDSCLSNVPANEYEQCVIDQASSFVERVDEHWNSSALAGAQEAAQDILEAHDMCLELSNLSYCLLSTSIQLRVERAYEKGRRDATMTARRRAYSQRSKVTACMEDGDWETCKDLLQG